MEHNLHANAQLHHHHWGYGAAAVATAPQNHWIPPPQSQHTLSAGPAGNGGGSGGGSVGGHSHGRSLKRAMSESDCDDLYSEESSKEQISPSESGSCQLMSRKKRRGVIEKKRRDRINSSLTELKRLVPTAYEKQGSAKLEKAEILQLTVEHLKNLQGKGIDSLAYDPQRIAMEYHIIGFRECAAEVARYLITIEGMEIQDPLRLRLMSHLQYFAQQRELSAKSCASPGAWGPAPNVATAYTANCGVPPYQAYPTSASVHSAHSGIATAAYATNIPAPIHPYPAVSLSPNAMAVHQQQQQQQHQQQQQQQQHQQQQQQQHTQTQQHAPQATTAMHPGRSSSASASSTSNEALPLMSQPQAQQATPVPQAQTHYTQEHNTHADLQSGGSSTYIELSNAQTHPSHRDPSSATSLAANAYATATSQYPVAGSADYNSSYVAANGSKPYRPWGAEMAY